MNQHKLNCFDQSMIKKLHIYFQILQLFQPTQYLSQQEMNIQQNKRLCRISKQLNKLDSLIQSTKNESLATLQLLQNCHQQSISSSSDNENSRNSFHSRKSSMLGETESKDTFHIINNKVQDQFYQEKSLQMSRLLPINKDNQYNPSSHFIIQNYNLLSEEFKQSTIQISQIKLADATIKKAKPFKYNLNKSKKNLYEKQSILSNNKNKQKIGRFKSQNKFLSNASNFKRGINTIKEQKSLKKQKAVKVTPLQTQNITLPHKKYLSNRIQTLNSKRNFNYNSVAKNVKIQRPQKQNKSSKDKFHINLQQQVTMKITDLKIQKNLCQIQTSYLSASVKITKQQIIKIDDPQNKYSDQTLLKYFVLKSIIKFISQYNDETWTYSQDIQIDNEKVTNTIKKPQKFIKIINKLPDILRRKNNVSQFICKQFIEDKLFIEQKVNNLSGKTFQKQHLYIYLCQLHSYIEFLLNKNMIHQTKRHKIFNPNTQQLFSDRSNKQIKLATDDIKEKFFGQPKKKDFSERKKNINVNIKRVSSSKALKYYTATTKSRKV